MKKRGSYSRHTSIYLLITFLFIGFGALSAQAQVYFSDDFEGGLGNWSVSGSDWAVIDTDSVSSSHSVTDSPGGDYTPSANASLTLANPLDLSGATSPVLSFWQKLYMPDGTSAYDYVYVEISEDAGISWTQIYTTQYIYIDTWSNIRLDLSPYITSQVLVRFRLRGDSDSRIGDGWYIDDVEIMESDPLTTPYPFSDDFEGGLGNWRVSGSDWAVIDTDSVSSSHSVTDSPGGDYTPFANASLTLAHPIDLLGATSPVLSFWQKLYMPDGTSAYDYVYVEISEDAGITWTQIYTTQYVYIDTWSNIRLDLSPYITSQVLVRFRLRGDSDSRIGDGWYIDDVEIMESDPLTTPYPFSDDFEGGLGNWRVSGSDWAVIDTDSVSSSHSVTDSPGGDYTPFANASLTLAHPIDLLGATSPVLSFWQKLYMPDGTSAYDYVYVEISEDAGITWTQIYTTQYIYIDTWSNIRLDLSPYITSQVLVRFRLRGDSDSRIGDGWYIDDVEIMESDPLTTPYPFSDDFEGGLGNWRVSGSDWAVIDTDSVSSSHSVTDSPGGDYTPFANASLTLAHPIDLLGATSPVLSFWQKLYMPDGTSAYDYVYVEISEDAGITWTQIYTTQYVYIDTWSNIRLDLSPYITSQVLVRFRLRGDSDSRIGDGWYIDDVEITGINPPTPYYCDKDSDGHFNAFTDGSCTGTDCIPAGCKTTAGDDCNDNEYSVNPQTTEGPAGDPSCSDGLDNDCDGKSDTADADCPVIPPGENNPPSIPELVSPPDGQAITEDTVIFEWTKSTDLDGDTVTYELIICRNPDFTLDCETHDILASLNEDTLFFAGSGIGMLFFGIVLADGVRNRKRKILLLIALAVSIALFSAACGSSSSNGGPGPEPEIVTVTGTVLNGNGTAVEGAEVRVISDQVTGICDSDGYFSLEVAAGNHDLEIRKGQSVIHTSTFSCSAGTCDLGNMITDVINREIGLTLGTTYYWKIIASDSNGGVTESEVRSFTTSS